MAKGRPRQVFHQQQKQQPQTRAPTAIAVKFQEARAFHKQGELARAELLYRDILEQVPTHSDAWHFLGSIESQKKNFAAAVECIGRAVNLNPDSAAAHSNLGNALRSLRRYEDALASYDRALSLKPDYAEAFHNRGAALEGLKRHEEALASYDRALALNPDFHQALNNRGNALRELKLHEEALASYDRALSLKPDYVSALSNRGNVLRHLRRPEEALASYDRALSLKPDFPQALNNLGNALRDLKQPEEALASYDRALSLKPDYAEALNNRGNALRELKRHEEALASYNRALAVQPTHVEAHHNLGNALQAQGKLQEAATCYRKALSIKPDDAMVHHALIHTMTRMAVDNADVFAQCRIFAAQFEQKISRLSHRNSRDPDRKLKVGYMSGDFCQHSIAYFIEPVLANHDRQAVEVFCYFNHGGIDHVTERLMRYPDHWRSVVGLSDDEVAALVQQDGIDILVDLSGHTAHNRLLTFARKPAPVQVTWLGLPTTTGLSAMDYRLTNQYADPVGMTERYHTETLVRLSHSSCFQPQAGLPDVLELPALSNGYVTFASFNSLHKIPPPVYALWTRLLGLLPNARLMMICDDHASHARQTLSAHGIGAERLVFVDKLPMMKYLALHNQVDIALDTFPYNGSTITRNALWMGVPVVSLAGSTAVSRAGLGLLTQAGLETFVAGNEEEYVQIALRWAHDLEGLAQIRRTLRQRMQEATFSDAKACTRNIEAAYRQMWRTWCAG